VLAACRLLVGISVQSMSSVQDQVNVVQLRILTVIASHDVVTLSELATATGLHMSRASRACDRLAHEGLIAREADPQDRRNLRLTLTGAGAQIVADVAAARRSAVEPALRRMTAPARLALVTALDHLTATAGEPAEPDLWALGWTT
jgi:DNA-binding MarR family transcriptional regulator